jgi:hypothetical protein
MRTSYLFTMTVPYPKRQTSVKLAVIKVLNAKAGSKTWDPDLKTWPLKIARRLLPTRYGSHRIRSFFAPVGNFL